MSNSLISKICVDQRVFYVKRDDLIDPFLAGNKYRKLYTLLQTPSQQYTTLISYGGSQSNAMLALAALCKLKKWTFVYYTKTLNKSHKGLEYGNYTQAVALGMQHHEIAHEYYREYISSLRVIHDVHTIVVDQGGADEAARIGLDVLATEIREANLGLRSLATPSGTGTTALFLACALPEYRIYTTPCVGDSAYLKEQMLAIHEKLPENLVILDPKRKYHFAKPYQEFFEIYKKLLACGIEFDLLYAPSMWQALLEQTKEEIMYIHSGGVSGNQTMLERYKSKFSLSM